MVDPKHDILERIIIRMPNWLGDVIMATGLVNLTRQQYPQAKIDIILKKGLAEMAPYIGNIQEVFLFDKNEYRGLKGVWKFGREIKSKYNYDLFICLPDSFSSAIMAKAVHAKITIGFKKELRSFLFTYSYNKPDKLHRADQYVFLLSQFLKKKFEEKKAQVHLSIPNNTNHSIEKTNSIIFNINSEAQSRRLTKEKAIEILNYIGESYLADFQIIMIGSSKEKELVADVIKDSNYSERIVDISGKTTLSGLVNQIAKAKLIVTTDSGPQHMANAVNTSSIVLFGAGDESNTGPYHLDITKVIRVESLPCKRCLKNICPLYEKPICLETINSKDIVSNMQPFLQ